MPRKSLSPLARRYRERVEAHASRMRAEPTPSEALVWDALRRSRLGVAFRRQVVLGDPEKKLYVVDFCAPSLKLVIEVDGGHHETRAKADAKRDEALRRLGYRVVRVVVPPRVPTE